MAFWMDTLCVPVPDEHKAYRKKSIAHMSAIYQEADIVLVLDSWLQEIPRSVNITEKAIRMYLANWQRRLWTLQEGILAKKLYIQFNDAAQNIDDTSEGLLENRMTRQGFYSTIIDTCHAHATVAYTLLNIGPSEPDEIVMKFAPFVREIQNRGTTRKSDETICVTTSLGLSTTELLEVPEQESMVKFLTIVKHFEPQIISATPNSWVSMGAGEFYGCIQESVSSWYDTGGSEQCGRERTHRKLETERRIAT
jgi:hypothetical protein